ncbi:MULTISPECIES: MoxR family ATPase [Acaryochloris]|uniref:Methanol dehydrogenase regulatory protein, putative n=1 Tax=Acaryochloris marina (strain MBIC 11017) TaxID=329726 RepID=B0C324_ACAM1|nr:MULTISPECIES: AAA family ATPase [Acaryochloris]ABW27371.1 methanol dehydrogenase regulatory protein, putative [Acaryochloris marina MBIC11017]KAI9134122.1 MoxR family ATPase [Acaryochloris sp. CCMEE 5410]BDM82112.1 magnesium chelatase [Acaryochloris marina MBIC10699]
MNPSFKQLQQQLSQIVIGQDAIVEGLLIALLAEGHVILEGVPGTAKTLIVKLLATLISADFRRIQLTPDVLPADILGTNIFDFNSKSFTLSKGPIFTQILLADEINRTPPKTQAALLEAMEERQVTLDGKTIALSKLFWTIATQNPLEFEGTYPLPEAQLDRFLLKLVVSYPGKAAEQQMLHNILSGFEPRDLKQMPLEPVITVDQVLEARQQVRRIRVEGQVLDYLLELVMASRQQTELMLGASPRAAVGWLRAAQAHAWLAARDFVTPDDVKTIAAPLLQHRLILKPEAQLDGVSMDQVIQTLLTRVPVPR